MQKQAKLEKQKEALNKKKEEELLVECTFAPKIVNHKVFQVNLLTKSKEAATSTPARATVIEAEPEVKTYKMNERSRKILE